MSSILVDYTGYTEESKLIGTMRNVAIQQVSGYLFIITKTETRRGLYKALIETSPASLVEYMYVRSQSLYCQLSEQDWSI